ncbi:MAG TPA: P-type conjugative transfer protein TrbL [Chlorobaculum parvum]|uniref:P-type conjugative transfer protein TrbL n=1 Tax=Chlorobaculum parvum TaxID=274539 RepID=A0A7C5HPZ7_9CHLB|nr:P-type conjugative transfer protein TrbL [Chlorobaculum parvum]
MNPGILTQTLNNFLTAFGAGWANLQPAINWLTGALLGIEIVMLGLWWALGGGEQLVAVMKKILYLGIWMWIVRSFPTLADAFVKSLIQAGQLAGGGGGPSLFDPSKIIEYGLTTTAPLVDKMSTIGITEIVNGIILALTYIGIMLAYILIAWQIFYAVLEFNLLAAVVGIFLPFGFLEQTKFLAEKAIGAIVSSGIKLMVLAFIMAVIEPTLSTLTFSSGLTFTEIWSALLTVGAVAFLAWNAPGIAAGLLAGSPSLSAGTAVQNALVGGTGVALAGMGAYGLTKMAVEGAGKIGAAMHLTGSSMSGGGTGGTGAAVASGPAPAGPSNPSAAASNPASATSGVAGGGSEADQKAEAPKWAKTALHAMHSPEEAQPSGGSATPRL